MTHQHGTGVGTPFGGSGQVTPIGSGGASCGSAISLVRYAQRVGYMECAFFGVVHPDNANYACRQLWTQAERDMIAWALAEAQQELEQEIGYHLSPCWTVDERHVYASSMRTRWGHVIAPGVIGDVMLEAGALVNHTTDPATVSTMAASGCALGNIHLFYPGTDIEILPTGYSGTAPLVFSIPWCRMVAPAYQDTPEGLQYADVATWITHTVDIRCIGNDDSTQATLIYRHGACQCTHDCDDTRKAACIYIRDEALGHVEVVATTGSSCCCGRPDWVLLNYLSGLTTLTAQAEDAIIRLAHSKMATEPCGCDVTQRLWARDRAQGDVLTRERINCPFGTSDGAWWAYRQAQTMRLGKAGVL